MQHFETQEYNKSLWNSWLSAHEYSTFSPLLSLAFGTHFIRGQRTDIRYNNRIPVLRFQKNSRVLGRFGFVWSFLILTKSRTKFIRFLLRCGFSKWFSDRISECVIKKLNGNSGQRTEPNKIADRYSGTRTNFGRLSMVSSAELALSKNIQCSTY